MAPQLRLIVTEEIESGATTYFRKKGGEKKGFEFEYQEKDPENYGALPAQLRTAAVNLAWKALS